MTPGFKKPPRPPCVPLADSGPLAMGTQRTRTALLVKLEALRRDVGLIRQARDREDRRVLLSCFLRDLRPFKRLELDLLNPWESALLKELLDAAGELRRETRRHGTSSRRATATIRASTDDTRRKPSHRPAPAARLPKVRKQDPRGDRSSPAAPQPAPVAGGVEEILALDRPLTRAEWRQLGFHFPAAKHLAEKRTTLAELRTMTRRKFLNLQGIGPRSLQVCERLLGCPLPSEQPDAEIRYWLSRGLQHRSARALVRAGISSLPDLAGTSREALQSLGGVGSHVIARLEELLGCPLPLRSRYWMELGLSLILSRKLVHARIYSVADFSALTRESFLAIPGMGETALDLCQKATGRTLRSPINYWLDRGVTKKLSRRLVTNRIMNIERLRQLGYQGLRRLGYGFYEIDSLFEVLERQE